MIEKDDWRLLNDVEYLKNKYINPTDGEELTKYANHVSIVNLLCRRVNMVCVTLKLTKRCVE